jgi:hypothetical protein
LVKQSHIIDDTYHGNSSFIEDGGMLNTLLKESHQFQNSQSSKEHTNWKDHCCLKKCSEVLLGLDTCNDVIALSWELFCTAMTKEKRGDTKKAVLAASMYCACKIHKRGIPAQAVYSHFNIPIWKHFTGICENWRDIKGVQEMLISLSKDDALKRMIYSNSEIPDDLLWSVCKTAYNIRDKLNGSLSDKIKASKLNVCLIYIACSVVGCSLSKQKIKELYGVTPVTLIKHETMIQLHLEKCCI